MHPLSVYIKSSQNRPYSPFWPKIRPLTHPIPTIQNLTHSLSVIQLGRGKEFSPAYRPGPRAALTKTSVRNDFPSVICICPPPSKSIARSGMRLWRIRYRCDTSLRPDCRAPSDRQPSSRKTQRTLPVCLTKTSDLCLTRPSGAPCALWMGNVASAHCLWHGNPFRPKSVTAAAVTKTSAVMPCIQPPSGASSIIPFHSVRYLIKPRAIKSFKKRLKIIGSPKAMVLASQW